MALQTACNEPVGFQPWLSDKVFGARGNSPRLMIKVWVVPFKCLQYTVAPQYNPYARCQPRRIGWSLLGLLGVLLGNMRPLRPVQSQPHHPFVVWLCLSNWCELLVCPAEVRCRSCPLRSLAIGSGPQKVDKSWRYH